MPDWRAEIEKRLPASAVAAAQQADVLNELAQHLEDRFDELRESGLDMEAARRQALAELDHSEQLVRELQLRRRRHAAPPPLGDSRPSLAGDLWLDVRFGLRMLRKTPGFTFVAALTLALGIGANTAIFTVINAALLRPLPFVEPGRLIRIYESNPVRGWPTFSASYPNYLDWVAQSRTFELLAATTTSSPTLMDGGQAERVNALLATHTFLPMLGVGPMLGRNFEGAEDRPGGNTRVALLTFGYWQRRFGGNAAVVGSTITLNDRPYNIIGILPERFRWGSTLDMIMPLAPDPARDRGDHRILVYGRLQRGVSHDQATADLVAVARRLEQQFPESNAGWTVRTVSFYDWIVPLESRRSLQMIGVAVIAVLLIACGNVASLMLARATTRQKEITVRLALGARRSRVVRQLLVESVLLALVAGAAGLFIAYGTTALLQRMEPQTLPRLDEISVDSSVMVYGFLLACAAGILCGVAPALSGLRADATESLKEAGRSGGTTAQRQRLRNTLIVGELALSVVLLVGASMLLRSFWQVQKVDPGFEPANLLTLGINLPLNRYDSQPKAWGFYERLLSGIGSLPGVRGVATTSGAPLSGGNTSTGVRAGPHDRSDAGEGSADWRIVSPAYFQTMGIKLRGREFAADDAGDRDRVAIISESFALRYFPGEDPIGKAVSLSSGGSKPRTIVGVAGDVRSFGLDAVAAPMVYFPAPSAASGWPLMTVVVRTAASPAQLTPSVRGVLRSIDPSIPFYNVATAEELLETSKGPRRFVMSLLVGFAAVAVILASVGLFGVMAYLVSQRAREIGIRLALGARPTDVRRSVVGRALVLASAGAALGIASAYWLSPVMESFLFEVRVIDPVAFVGAPMLLVAVALLASYLPARRAMRVDPITALREE